MVLPRILLNFSAIHLISELDLYPVYNLLEMTAHPPEKLSGVV